MFKIPLIFLISLSAGQCSMKGTPYSPSSQMIVVKSDGWESIKAKISLYEKDSQNNWIKFGEDIPAVLGKNGFGWGRGIFSPEDVKNNTYRQEGDKRAPAGIFTIGNVFGIEEHHSAQKRLNLKMPYVFLNETMQCVGEGKSKYYNQIVDTSKVEKDWDNDKNNEMMRYEGLRDEQAYKWGIFINNNSDLNPDKNMQRDKNAGSCIFIHIWKNEDTGTAGCTAIKTKDIEKIISWLDVRKKPLITQLPQAEYNRLKDKWNLP